MKKLFSLFMAVVVMATFFVMPTAATTNEASVGATEYATISEAITNAKAGDTVTLINDVTVTDLAGVEINKDLTIELNGKKVSFYGDGFVVDGADTEVIFKDSIGTAKVVAAVDDVDEYVAIWAKNGNVEIYGGEWSVANFDKDGEGNTVIYAVDADIEIYGGHFNHENTFNNYGKVWYFILNIKNTYSGSFKVYGGTYEFYDPSQGDDNMGGNFLADGYLSTKDMNDIYTVAATNPEAVIDTVEYATVEEAVANAKAGETVKLLKDVVVDDKNGLLIDKDLTFDLNGNSIDFKGDGFVVDNASKDITVDIVNTVMGPEQPKVNAATGGPGGWVALWAKNGTVNLRGGIEWIIRSGDSEGKGNSLLYTYDAVVNIYPGTSLTSENTYINYGKDWYYLCNVKNDKTGKFVVYGGSFENYDPSKGDDNLGGNFVAEGDYIVTEEKSDDSDIVTYYVHEHILTKTDKKEATCTEDGMEAYYVCSWCGEDVLFSDEKGTVVVEAKDLVIPAGHKIVVSVGNEPTCEKDGWRACYACELCEKLFDDEKATKELTDEDILLPAAHSLKKVEAKEATTEAEGNIEYYVCEGTCGKLFADKDAEKEITKADTVVEKLPVVDVPTDEPTDEPEVETPAIEITEEKAEVKEEAIEEAIVKAAAGATEDVVIDIVKEAEKDAEVNAAVLPTDAVESVAEINDEMSLTVNLTTAEVTMDNKAIEAITEQAEGATIELVVEHIEVKELTEKQQAAVKDKKVAVTVSASIVSDGEYIHDFKGGNVTVAVPFEVPANEKAEDYKVYYVADDGTVTEVKSEYKGGKMIFTVGHFSEYVIAAETSGGVPGEVQPEQKPEEDPKVPATGDNTNLPLYAVVILMSAMALVVTMKKRAF